MIPANKLVGLQSRRDMMKLAAFGALGGSACGWLDIMAQKSFAVEQATRFKAKSCIVLFMSGGPAHTWTFDLKGGDKGCPYQPIETSAPGIQISEYLPRVAKQMHHLALVRGMSTAIADHDPAHYLMRTGFRQAAGMAHPHIGSRVAEQLVREDTGMPNFVLIKPGAGGLRGASAGFLPPSCRPLILKDVSLGIANLNATGGLDAMKKKANLLDELDQGFLDEYQADAINAKMAGYRKAVQLMDLDKARSAFQFEQEPQAVRDLYGDSIFGKQCLGARRLIENGVKYVEVMHPGYWDTHGGQLEGQKKLSGVLDQPMAALLADLHQRGMLEETLVVWMGEFGRDFSGGNHYAKAWTTAFAGAGVKGGQVIGKTDAKGMTVVDRPVKASDFTATIFDALGIDYTKKTKVSGRPIGFVDGDVKPLVELFA